MIMIPPKDLKNTISYKLSSQLLEVVKGMDSKLKEQEVYLQKQEARVSLNEISALPSAQSSPKIFQKFSCQGSSQVAKLRRIEE